MSSRNFCFAARILAAESQRSRTPSFSDGRQQTVHLLFADFGRIILPYVAPLMQEMHQCYWFLCRIGHRSGTGATLARAATLAELRVHRDSRENLLHRTATMTAMNRRHRTIGGISPPKRMDRPPHRIRPRHRHPTSPSSLGGGSPGRYHRRRRRSCLGRGGPNLVSALHIVPMFVNLMLTNIDFPSIAVRIGIGEAVNAAIPAAGANYGTVGPLFNKNVQKIISVRRGFGALPLWMRAKGAQNPSHNNQP